MDEQRLQERTGGLAAEKDNDQLFFIDTNKEAAAVNKNKSTVVKNANQLKCHSNLTVAGPLNKPTNREEKIENKRLLKKAQGLSQRKADLKKIKAFRNKKRKLKDLWGAEEDSPQPEMVHHLRVTRQLRVHRPESLSKPTSRLPALELPHPGASYNPEANDYVNLLKSAHEVEVQKEKAALKLKHQMTDKFPTKEEAPTEASYIAEMSTGLMTQESSDESDGWEDLVPARSNPPVTTDKKKSPADRRKEKLSKKEEFLAQQAKQNKLKENAVYRLKSIKAEIAADERKYADRAWRKATKEADAEFKPKKLGKLKYEAPEIEIKLSEELVGSLRQLRQEGDVLADRFKSLQRRNIIEPRERQKHKRKYRLKKSEKKGHKEITE